jgi:hypothetical protein
MDTSASTGGFPGFSNTTNQALMGQPYDLLLLFKCTPLFLSYLVISFDVLKR